MIGLHELSARLTSLAFEMQDLAKEMRVSGSEKIRSKGRELTGAGLAAMNWASVIREEVASGKGIVTTHYTGETEEPEEEA